jgi:hypothetical protein
LLSCRVVEDGTRSNFTLSGQSLNRREESRDEASKGNQNPGQSSVETSRGKGIDKLTRVAQLENSILAGVWLAVGMAGHTDIFPKNEFCRTNAYGLINQALSLFHKTISSWSTSWRPTIYIHFKTLNL